MGMQRGQVGIQQGRTASMSVGGCGGSMRHTTSATGDGGRKRTFDSAVEVDAAWAGDAPPIMQGC